MEKVLNSLLQRSSFCIITSMTALERSFLIFPFPSKGQIESSSSLHTLNVMAFIQLLCRNQVFSPQHRGKWRRGVSVPLCYWNCRHFITRPFSYQLQLKKEDKLSGGQRNAITYELLLFSVKQEEMNDITLV